MTAREAPGNPLLELQRIGQSPWHDNIHRGLLEDGSLARMVRDGDITGLTSNPTIFEQAMTEGSAYDDSLAALVAAGRTPEGIVDTLVIDDIRAAADVSCPCSSVPSAPTATSASRLPRRSRTTPRRPCARRAGCGAR